MAPSRKRRPITVDDLQRLRSVAGPTLSPDGARVAFTVKHLGPKNTFESNLWLADVVDGRSRQFTHGGQDSQPAWSPDGQRLAFVSRRAKGSPQLALIDAAGGEARVLTDFPEGSLASFRWSPDGRRLAVSFREQDPDWTSAAVQARQEAGLNDPPRVLDDPWYRFDGDGYFNAQRFQLHVVDAESGERRLVYAKDRMGFFSYSWSPDGRRLALTTNRHRQSYVKEWLTDLAVLDVASRKLTTLEAPAGPKSAVAWSPDGSHIAWAGKQDEDGTGAGRNTHLWVCDAAGGSVRCLTERSDHCLVAPTLGDTAEVAFDAQLRWHPDGKRLWIQLGVHGETHLATVTLRGAEPVLHTSGRKQVRLGDLSADGSRMVTTVETATRPPEVHVADVPRLTGRTATHVQLDLHRISDVNGPLFAQLDIARPKATWVRSEDGSRVHTFTLLPPGASPERKRPTIVQIHGGPHAQYGWSFFHEFQVLAAAGYAVVYSNPRGSKGYGEDFCDGNSDRWGTTDWQDVQAVSQWAADQAFCDAKRLGIMGGSFGGYMTLWAIGHSKAYKAAIADRCVSNMVSMWGSSDVYIWPDSYFSGNTWDRTAHLWEMSPLAHLGGVKTPTLLIHSEGDLRCNVAESEQVHAALSLQGTPCRFVRYPRNTSHGMSRSGPTDMRIHRLEQILAWWDRWL